MNTILDVTIFVILVGIVLAIPTQALIRTRYRGLKKWRFCVACGYDRQGLEVNSPCTECGSVPGIVGLGKIPNQDQISCRACNHSLKGMEWNATCPECGLPSAAMPQFHHTKRRSIFSPIRLFDGALLGIWVLALFLVTLQVINIF